MAVPSSHPLDVQSLISQLESAHDCSVIALSDSKRLLRAAQKLVKKLDNPAVRLMIIALGPAAHAALRVAFNINLFEAFTMGRMTAKVLAHRCGVDPPLMVRIMRALLCIGIFDEDGEETYVHNLLSGLLRNKAGRAMIRGMAEMTEFMPALPDYLASIDYRNPNDRHNSLFGFAYQTDLNMYDWLQAHPEQMEIFNDFQSANAQLIEEHVQHILETLLAPGKILETSSSKFQQSNDKVLFVDVGGGRGEELRRFRKNHPELKGRIVIEDLPSVVEGQEVEEGVEAIAHDFFTPQPIKGANIYFFRFIFHNWPDTACREILRHTIAAMTSSQSQLTSQQSKLVISDIVLPATNATPFEGLRDLQKMALGGMERTETQWRDLLKGEGLRIEKMMRQAEKLHPQACLIFCVVANEVEVDMECGREGGRGGVVEKTKRPRSESGPEYMPWM